MTERLSPESRDADPVDGAGVWLIWAIALAVGSLGSAGAVWILVRRI